MNTRLNIRITNRLGEISRLKCQVQEFAEQNNLPEDILYKVNLSLDELLTNTISYGYCDTTEQPIDVTLQLSQEAIEVVISDNACEFNPLSHPDPDVTLPPEKRQIGGLGVYFVKTIMDSIQYRYENNKNVLTLVKKLKA